MMSEPIHAPALHALIDDYVDRSPGLFKRNVLHALLKEHIERGIDNSDRLFRALTSLVYLDVFGYEIV
jgi:hypothetical protein